MKPPNAPCRYIYIYNEHKYLDSLIDPPVWKRFYNPNRWVFNLKSQFSTLYSLDLPVIIPLSLFGRAYDMSISLTSHSHVFTHRDRRRITHRGASACSG